MRRRDPLSPPFEPAESRSTAALEYSDVPGRVLEGLPVCLPAAHDEISRLRDALAAAQVRERALTYELQHRVRNMLAVIRSVCRRTWETGASQGEFAEHLDGRLGAIARYQSQFGDVGSPGVELEDMLRNELLEGQCCDGSKCTIDGPAVHLQQKAAELMGLAIHELTTNSIKFGALAQGGCLSITWWLDQPSDNPRLRFRWTETGVSVAGAAPRPSGFGRQLIEEALPYQLGATASFELKPGGVDCLIVLPLGGPGTTDHQHSMRATDEPLLPSEAESFR